MPSLFSICKVVLEKNIFKKSLTYFHVVSYLPFWEKITKKNPMNSRPTEMPCDKFGWKLQKWF